MWSLQGQLGIFSWDGKPRPRQPRDDISQSLRGRSSPPIATLTTMADRKLPTFDELPKFRNFSGCAWEVWGKDDQLGTVNLLTEDVVKNAAGEIK